MSMTASGRRGSVLRRGRSMMTFTHASQPSSGPAAPPRRWTLISSWLRCHTRPNVPRRAPSHRLQSAPRCRRACCATTTASSSFPRHQTSAHGRPSGARHVPTSNTRFPRGTGHCWSPPSVKTGPRSSRRGPTRPNTASCPVACALAADCGCGGAVGPHGRAPLIAETRGESRAPHPGWAPARARREYSWLPTGAHATPA